VIGGAGDHAVRRAAEVGDGWLGIFCSARRYAETVGRIREAAAGAGRAPDWFGVTVWCGFDADPRVARDRLGATMQELYRLPPDRFAHLAPAGTPAQVAEFLAAYVSGGARHVTVVPVAASATAEVEAVAEVRRLLLTH
jgi:alkanesulfonate monooxygenase SsuD/methylene tetrahydromethanopterin reductase-like flavin-dependent oxidoreductase (luciferase family)